MLSRLVDKRCLATRDGRLRRVLPDRSAQSQDPGFWLLQELNEGVRV